MKKQVLRSLSPAAKSTFLHGGKSTFAATLALAAVGLAGGTAQAQLKGKTLPVESPAKPQPQPAQPALAPIAEKPAAPPKAGPSIPTSPAEMPSLLGSNKLSASLSVLVLGLDEADLRQSPAWQPAPGKTADEADEPKVDAGDAKEDDTPTSQLEKALLPPEMEIGDRPPGHSQMVAAPLRRILAGAGAGEVLNAPLDGTSMMRTLNAARLSSRVLSAARSTIRQIESQALQSSGAPAEIPAALQQQATAAFTRIGQAMGYRAVVAVVAPAAPSPGAPQALLFLVDAQEQTGQFIPVSAGDSDPNRLAAAAGALLLPRLSQWPPSSSSQIQSQVDQYLKAAKDAAAHNDLPAAQDYINQVVGLQPNNAKAYETLGDLLQKAAPRAAALAYSSALDITPENGPLWSKLALTYTLGSHPNWPSALDAAQNALSNGYDSALLRTVMASAEFGRARIFTKAGRDDQADLANRQAKDYLDVAMKLLPGDSSISAKESKLIAANLISAQRFSEAASILDTASRKYPQDAELQRLYAQALSGTKDRTEDAFVAWSAVWRLEKEETVPLDADRYSNLANGFDKHIFNLARAASMLTSSASAGTIPAASALPQVQRYLAMMKESVDALRLMHPPAGRLTTSVQASRLIAGDLFVQAVESYVLYLQNNNNDVLAHGGQLHYQAIDRLNAARKAS